MLVRQKNSPYLEDEELARLYQERQDTRILGLLFKRYLHEVLGNCMYFLKNQHDSEDASMEIFEQLTSSLKKNSAPDNFRNWLFIVTKNHCLKRLRKQIKERSEDFSEINTNLFVENDDLDALIIEQRIERLSHAIEDLKEEQKKCIILFYLQNKSYKEIEEVTPYSLNDVKSFIQNGRRNLKVKLS
ncbi:MAG: DNA-directed RNA polymerase sigma-70 factor [Saprospiraceae bacterium]|nr:MAG: DNA-directed RNA polymerase sigma-70 factor [Saprospiraceae bacterium]